MSPGYVSPPRELSLRFVGKERRWKYLSRFERGWTEKPDAPWVQVHVSRPKKIFARTPPPSKAKRQPSAAAFSSSELLPRRALLLAWNGMKIALNRKTTKA